MLSRRSLLFSASAFALGQLLTGCGGTGESAVRIRLLEDSVPPPLLKLFQRQIKGAAIDLSQSPQLADLFKLLKTWKQKKGKPETGISIPFVSAKPVPQMDLVTLGDYWLTPAIQQGLIQPLPLAEIPEWQQLPSQWQKFVQRDPKTGLLSESGELWAAPYRWGTLMMVYRVEAFQKRGWTPTDWKDLWRSELKQQISLPDSARAVIGLTLKKLGQSANLPELPPTLEAELRSLHQQVKFYSSDAYLQPLILEDTEVAVGWSTDILPLLERDRRLAGVVPQSGTLLTADLWVSPVQAAATGDRLALLKKWIGFYWTAQTATQLTLLSSAASPLLNDTAASPVQPVPDLLKSKTLLLPAADIQQRSELMLPIAAPTLEQYRRLWTAIRQR